MLLRTHVLITLFFVLLFFSHVSHQIIFVIVSFISTFIPDIDTKFSAPGNKKIFRPLQFFVKHRGILHSFTLLILLTVFFSFLIPILALPFFLGYGLHLLADSFTIEGIFPFYPSGKRAYWRIKTGGKSEIIVLVGFIIADLLLFGVKVFS